MDKKQPAEQQATCTNSDSWNCKYCNKTKTCAALTTKQATAAQAGAPANMRLCYSCGHPADAHPWVNDPRGGKRRGDCPAAPAQPAAQQGVAYAALPEPYCNAHDDADACYPDMFSEHQMRAFADATYALRASHGQAPATQQAGEVRRAELVPGVMHCAKCKFQLNRVTLCVSDGNAYAGNNKTEPCPNGCGPLWPVTWEQEAKNCWKALEEMHERLMAAAAPQPSTTAQADSVQEDAALWHWLAEYLVGTRTDLDDEIVASETVNDLRKLVKAAIKQGANHDR